MLYKDRGMKKWQGFILSEHGAALAENKRKQDQVVEEKSQQSEREIGMVLEQAYKKHVKVKVQVNVKENSLYKNDIEGFIQGFEDDYIFISHNGTTESVELSTIRHVESVVSKKWYE